MDPSVWKRDASKVNAALVKQLDGSVLTTRPIKIYVPERYTEKGLAEIGSETFIVGIYAIVVDDKYYAVSKINATMRIKPTTISTVKFDGTSYLEFYFEPGSVVIATTSLIKSDTLVYHIFNYFISNGAVPWFLEYEDVATLFESAERHAGVRLTKSHSILEMFAAAITRDPQQRTKYYRHTLEDTNVKPDKPVTFIALRNISLGATNTTARLQGSYWSDGMTSALANPSTRTERIEQLLRS
ncbi:hypothetical protein LUCX_10 [Xanthomonas phage vB_XciM_LucasX]|nr:hypothetical protein LUCX_10 [Xanthomonas phage vB_XciM_LucasX]